MSDTRTDARPQPRTFAEKVSLVIASLLLVSVVGAILFLWFTDESTPARFEITEGQPRVEGASFYLPVTVTNSGDATASEVTVEGSVSKDGTEQTATTTFDFVPGHSQVETVLIFEGDPGNASVRVVSYQEP